MNIKMKNRLKSLANGCLRAKANFSGNYFVGSGSKILYSKMESFVSIGEFCNITRSSVGKCTYLGDRVSLPFTKIGRFCSIAPNVTLGAGNHPVSFVSTHPATYSMGFPFPTNYVSQEMFDGEYAYADQEKRYYCEIGNDVWIATNATLLCGKRALHIGDGVVVGGGTCVKTDIPPYAIVQGVPARIVGYRFEPEVIEQLLTLKWWDKSDEWLKNYARYFHDPEQLFAKVGGMADEEYGKFEELLREDSGEKG